jgi:hypothetical protein
MVMLLEMLTGKNCYISMVIHGLMGTSKGSEIVARTHYLVQFFPLRNNPMIEFFMKRKASIFVVVHAIRSLSPGDELLINYNFRRPPTACQKYLALDLPLDIPLGRKKKMIE